MNLATFLERPRVGLGQAPATDDSAAWAAYVGAVRAGTVASWNRLQRSYVGLQKLRADLGVPLVVPTTEANPPPGSITDTANQRIVELGTIATLGVQFLDDVLADRRRLVYVSDSVGLGIEALDSDTTLISYDPATNRVGLVDRQGNPVAVTGSVESIGQLGIAPIIWVAGAAVVIAAAIAGYFTIQALCDTATSITRQAVNATIEAHSHDLIASGKSTPQQEQQRIKAVYDGAAQVAQAEAAVQAAKGVPGSTIEKTVTTFLWVGLGVAAIYALFQIVGRRQLAVAA